MFFGWPSLDQEKALRKVIKFVFHLYAKEIRYFEGSQ